MPIRLIVLMPAPAIQSAVKALYDSLRETDTLYRSAIICTVLDVLGVVDLNLVQPSANYVPPPPATAVELVVWGKIEMEAF